MREPFDPTIIVLALVAIFVLWKLRSILGTRTGTEKPPHDPFARPTPERPAPGQSGPTMRLPGAPPAEDASAPIAQGASYASTKVAAAAEAGVRAIAAASPGFSLDAFLSGARAAYEIVLKAFAAGDRGVLRNLLSPEAFAGFEAVIAGHEAAGEKVETTLVSLDREMIEDARLEGRRAVVAVRFETKLVTVTRDRGGAVKSGDPNRINASVDIWTFARELDSRNPNWTLVATETTS